MLRVTLIDGLFDGHRRTYRAEHGKTLGELLPGLDWETALVEVDGRKAGPSVRPRDRSHIVALATPGDPVSAAFVAIGVAAVGTFAALEPQLALDIITWSPFRDWIFGKPGDPPGAAEEDASVPRFRGVQTSIGPGAPVPFVLGGPIRIGGHVIESSMEVEYQVTPSDPDVTEVARVETSVPGSLALRTRIAWGWGPFESIGSFELDDNPVANVKGVSHQTVLGTEDQKPPTGATSSKNQRSVSTGTVTQTGGRVVIQTVAEVDSVEVELVFAGLYEVDGEGHLATRDVDILFEYRKLGAASWTSFQTATASGAQRSLLSFWARFPDLELDVYEIGVTRVTADNDDVANPGIIDDFTWESLTEVRAGVSGHPGVANTEFRQIPQEQQASPRKYTAMAKGHSDVRVYTTTSAYTQKWTDNPAWLCAHFLTHPVIGPGSFFAYESNIDLASFLDWAEFCDEIVNGEKRCRFGYEFDRSFSVDEIVRIFEDAGEASVVYAGGIWRAVPHKTESRVNLFGDGKWDDTTLEWSTLDTLERPTRISARYQTDEGEPDAVSESDPDATGHWVEIQEELRGVFSKTQARRHLVRRMNSFKHADEGGSFEAGLAAIDLKVGDVIGIAATTGGVAAASGRVWRVSADQTRLELDKEITLASATSYDITLMHQDAAKSITTLALRTDSPGLALNWVEVNAPAGWKAEAKPGDVYSIEEVEKSVMDVRVVKKERIGQGGQLRWRIEWVKEDPLAWSDKHVFDESDAISGLNPRIKPAAVAGLTLAKRLPEDSAANTHAVIDVHWRVPSGDYLIREYEVWYRENGLANWSQAGVTKTIRFAIGDVNPTKTYDVAVIAVSPLGQKLSLDDAATATIDLSA